MVAMCTQSVGSVCFIVAETARTSHIPLLVCLVAQA